MKLIYRILYRLSIALLLVLGIWGAFFYLTVIDEINDETDDSLEDYSEIIIRKALTGQELPNFRSGFRSNKFFTQVFDLGVNKVKVVGLVDVVAPHSFCQGVFV